MKATDVKVVSSLILYRLQITMILTSDTQAMNRTAVNTLASLIFISVNGPPSEKLKPQSYVENGWKKAGIPRPICQPESIRLRG